MAISPVDYSEQLLTAWDIYITFYTVFLTVNLAALGVVVEKVETSRRRTPIAAAFMAQNMISGATAMWISGYSANLGMNVADAEPFLAPLRSLGRVGGIGNASSHAVLCFLWIVIAALPLMPSDEKVEE